MASALIALASGLAGAAEPSPFTSTFVARWNLTHGRYLVDIGEYLEAIEAFDTAIEMADAAEVRSDAQLQKASVLSLFLDAPDESVAVYEALLARDPASAAAEAALLRAGMVLFDRGQYARAATYFDRYVQRYPNGASRGSAEFLLRQSRARSETAPAPSIALPTATASPALPPSPTAVPGRIPTETARSTHVPTAAAPAATPTAPVSPRPTPVAAPAALPPSIEEVRIRVFKGHKNVRIEADSTLTLTPALAGGRAVELTARGGLVSVDGQEGVPEVTIGAERDLTLRAGGSVRRYRGRLTVRADGGTLLIVNRVGIEEYLYGVVTKESAASWPPEALQTQAIASRTYALYQVQHRRERGWDMVDDEGSQVYGGVDGESASGRRAVDQTRGQVLVYRGRPIYAMFTSNTGWYTGDPKFIFDQPLPYLNAVPDPYSPSEQLGRWTRTYSTEQVRRALGDIGVRLGPIRAIEPRVTCPSGRIVRVAIEDDSGAHLMRTRPTLGRALKLPEILVEIRRDGDRFVFAGGGFGHGVGLSQWGAKNMASKGHTARDILAFYYRGAELTTLTGEP